MKKVSLMVAMALLVLGFAFTLVLVPQAHAQSYSRSTTTSLTKISKATQPNADRCGGGAWVASYFAPSSCVYTQEYFSAVIEICSDPGVYTAFVYLDPNTGAKQGASILPNNCKSFPGVAGDVSVSVFSGCIVSHRTAYVGPTSPRC